MKTTLIRSRSESVLQQVATKISWQAFMVVLRPDFETGTPLKLEKFVSKIKAVAYELKVLNLCFLINYDNISQKITGEIRHFNDVLDINLSRAYDTEERYDVELIKSGDVPLFRW